MRFANVTSLAFAAALAVPVAASAQYGQGVQPYNPQDPQNYGAPAAQSYSNSQQQAPQYQQAPPQYRQPQQNQGYAPQGYQDQRYDPRAYDQQQAQDQNGQYPLQQGGPSQGQEQIYQAPPPLPNYDQPPAPSDGNIWTPGYWAFGPSGYYWVPGAWVAAPYDGALWTPGYWGDGPSGYFWNAGYWAPVVGYYGGINYGFGYFGVGFFGGYWRDHRFWYNREYSHVGFGVRNFYSQRYEGYANPRPGGRSFTTASAPRGFESRGGTFAGNGTSRGGFAGQPAMGHAAYPGSTYSSMSRGNAGAPVQRSAPAQTYSAPRAQGFSGGGGSSYGHASAPAAHYSAPSGGGGGGHASSGGHSGGHR